MARKALIIEDNADMRDTLASFLSDENFSITALASCEEGIDAVDEQNFDIVLADINLPGKSGFDLIEYIRDQGLETPIIALTARDAINDRLTGFDRGANDYMIKPFNLRELLARIQAQLRNAGTIDEEKRVVTPSFSIDPKSMEFLHKKKPVELTQLEFKLMHLLMLHNGSLVKLDDLIEFVWGEEEDMLNPPVRIHIGNLRKKINDQDFSIVKTIPGTGYILKDEVS